eukprot:7924302-Pyramimonas_sp.AAC.1
MVVAHLGVEGAGGVAEGRAGAEAGTGGEVELLLHGGGVRGGGDGGGGGTGVEGAHLLLDAAHGGLQLRLVDALHGA